MKWGEIMKDEYGRDNTKFQSIREFKKEQLAFLLNDISKNPKRYPQNEYDWVKWLNDLSGEGVENL